MIFQIKRVFLSIFFIFIITGCFAKDAQIKKGAIYGRITFLDDTPVASAIVSITNSQQYTMTDEAGNYRLNDITYGENILNITTLEAEPKEVVFECNTSKQELNIKGLTRAISEMSEIMVEWKSKSQIIKDKGYAMSVVEVEKSTLGSLQASDILDRSSGIKLRQNGGLGSDIQYNINGLSGNSIRLFIDGIPIRSYGSSFSLASIPPSMIERIEVYKGVVPIHLSEDALGGAVNIILKQTTIKRLSTSYSLGSFNTHKWNINGNYRDEKSGFTAGGSAFYNYTDNSYKVWGDPINITDPTTGLNSNVTAKRFHDSYQSAGINTTIGFTQTKWADRFILGLLYSEMEKDIQHGATMAVVYGNRRSAQNTKMANLQYEKSGIFERVDVSAFGSYSSGVRTVVDTMDLMYSWMGDLVYKPDGTPFRWDKGGGEAGKATLASNLEQNIAGRANIAYEFMPKHQISASTLYNRFTRDVNDPLLPELEQALTNRRSLTKQVLGLSYENRLINDRFKLSVFYKHYTQAVKLTDPTYDADNTLQPLVYDKTTLGDGFGGAVSFKLKPIFTLAFSAEKALRMPDNNEVLGNTTDNVEVSYELRPEQSANLNLGILLGPFRMGIHSVSAEANIFYRNITDMIQKSLPIGVTEELYHYENIGKILSKGFDLDIRYDFKDMLFVDFNLSNFNARYNLEYDTNGDRYLDYGKRLRNAPYLTFNNNIRYVKKDLFKRDAQLTASYNLGYVHEFFRNSEAIGGAGKAVIPTQLIHDIGVTYTFSSRKISLGFDVKNLTNEQVFDNWALQKPGRAFYLKLSYNIIN